LYISWHWSRNGHRRKFYSHSIEFIFELWIHLLAYSFLYRFLVSIYHHDIFWFHCPKKAMALKSCLNFLRTHSPFGERMCVTSQENVANQGAVPGISTRAGRFKVVAEERRKKKAFYAKSNSFRIPLNFFSKIRSISPDKVVPVRDYPIAKPLSFKSEHSLTILGEFPIGGRRFRNIV
jgi:hypothetical protein